MGPADGAEVGLVLHRSVLVEPWLTTWAGQIEARYLTLEAARREAGPCAPGALMSPGQRYVSTASSCTLGEIFPGEDRRILFAEISASPVGTWTQNELKGPFSCDLEQSWVRRQYAPANYPPWHAPHGWHQDGALGFDFLSPDNRPDSPDAVLRMVTCWIALTPCGSDAPGLEFITTRLDSLLRPGELTDSSLRARFRASEFWRPELAAGDAVVFRGDLLHRTYVTPAMTKNRTSLELRYFPGD